MKKFLPSLTSCLALGLVLAFAGTQPAQAQSLEFLAENTSGPTFHIVKKGETLYGIARMYKVTIQDLTSLNKLTSSNIYVGQRLLVSNQAGVQPAETGSRPSNSRGLGSPATSEPFGEVSSLDALTGAAPNARQAAPDAFRGPQTMRIEKKEFALVATGENMYSLAAKYNVSVEELREWNNLTEVRQGDVIVVRRYFEDITDYDLDQPISPAAEVASRGLVSSARQQAPAANARMAAPAPQQATRSAEPAQTSRSMSAAQPAPAFAPAYARPESFAQTADWSRGQIEQGPYDVFEFAKAEELRFYAVHKSLPAGTKVKLDIPNNSGYVEVMIVGKLSDASRAFIGLSPACITLLEGAGAKGMATIFYE